jgi:DNA-directed RNA polymerase specialized sigma subunit
MARRKKQVKQFSGYIEGDDELRKQIFKNKPASQQVIFELFSYLDHLYYGFFQFFCAIPSSAFWDLIMSRISAAASVADRNRNFCENYAVLEKVVEKPSDFKPIRSKILDLVGAAHGMWFTLSDPDYSEQPDCLALWQAFYETNPSRVVWEWWIDQKYLEVKKLLDEHRDNLQEPHVVSLFEDWAQESLGLEKPRSHWWITVKHLVELCAEVKRVKDKIANPYLRLVYTVTKGIAAYNQPDQFCDTYAIGCTGLMRSIAKYAPSMSLAFPTFAEREIRYEIYYQLSNYNIISLPHRTWQKYRKFEDMRNEYHRFHGKELTIQEFAEVFRYSLEEVYEVYSQVGMQNPTSLDQALYIDEDNPHVDVEVTLKDKLEDVQIKEMRNLFDEQEVLLLALKRMPSKLRKFFIYSNNLCELVHDEIKPNKDELTSFFVHHSPTRSDFFSPLKKIC